MSKQKLTTQQVEHMIRNWQGNKGGRRSLYSLCKEHDIPFELGYVVLASDPDAILKKVAAGKNIVFYSPVAQR